MPELSTQEQPVPLRPSSPEENEEPRIEGEKVSTFEDVLALWPEILNAAKGNIHERVAVLLDKARLSGYSDGVLDLEFDDGQDFHIQQVKNSETQIIDAIGKFFKGPIRLRYTTSTTAKTPKSQKMTYGDLMEDLIRKDPPIRYLKDHLGAELIG